MVIGVDRSGAPVRIPFGSEAGCHTLVVGATGSGKTVTQAWIAARTIEHGHGAIIIDPKGDPLLRQQVRAAAATRGAQLFEWTPAGPCTYNPYAHGGDSELADKALAGEVFTEPHYQRQAQRYLGHAVRTMRAAGVAITPASLVAHLSPGQLDVTARALDDEHAGPLHEYLDSLGERQRRELAGVRDRLSILAESDLAKWLQPTTATTVIDLPTVARDSAVAYFSLEADRWPLLAQMLAAAIVGDLLTMTADLQTTPRPTLVLIDEFAAIASAQVARLFARARSAGISLLLGTQELADLRPEPSDTLRDQVLGNISTLIAHRQNVPASAELVAAIAGTRPVWVHTQRVDYGLLGATRSDAGTRTRGYEYIIHPATLKNLYTGTAVIATPGGEHARIARINHPTLASRV
jgi:type IV secretory pathway TraG/TraD family ATPase VirD4